MLLLCISGEETLAIFLTQHSKRVFESYSIIFEGRKTKEIDKNNVKKLIIQQSILVVSALKSSALETIFFTSIRQRMSIKFVHKIIAPALLNGTHTQHSIAKILTELSLAELEKSVSAMPQAPNDWQRAIPAENKKRELWNILIPFLVSPTIESIEYRKAETFRRSMESLISNAGLDVDIRTVKKGTPHTLVITKNEASYKN